MPSDAADSVIRPAENAMVADPDCKAPSLAASMTFSSFLFVISVIHYQHTKSHEVANMTYLAHIDDLLVPSVPTAAYTPQADFLALRYTQDSYGLRYGRTNDYAPDRRSEGRWIQDGFRVV